MAQLLTRALVAALAAATIAAPGVAAQRGPAMASPRLPADVIGLACAPTAALAIPDMPLRVTGGQDAFTKRNYVPGDLVTINAGSVNNIEVGQEYFVRRVQADRSTDISPLTPGTIRTAGWIRIYAVDDTMSLATISHACDAIEVGDYLEPFALPVVPRANPDKPKAERDNYARVLPGADRRRSFGRGDYLVIDRGIEGGVTPGAQFVLYRNKQEPENFLYELGEAVAVDVKGTTATLQVTLARDAIQEGDLVAQRK